MKQKRIVKRCSPYIGEDETINVRIAMASNQLARGDIVEKFEELMGEYIGGWAVGITTTSGFAALHLAVEMIEIGGANEVIIPSYSCRSLLHAVHCARAVPILVDSYPETMNMSLDSYEQWISDRTKAVIIPHTFGFPADIEAFRTFDKEVQIIEDCATGLGGMLNGEMLGSFGDLSAFSFYATKIITTAGEGGMLSGNNPQDWFLAKQLADYKAEGARNLQKRYSYRMTEMQAAMGLVQLDRLLQIHAIRAELWQRYRDNLDLPSWGEITDGPTVPSFYTYAVDIDNPHQIAKKMLGRGIECLAGGYEGIHRILGLPDSDFPGTTYLLEHVLLLPLHPGMTIDDVDYVCENLNQVMEEL